MFARLFSPLTLGPLRAANRIVAAPHSTNMAEANRVSERQLAYYGEKARGGAGIVTIGGLRIHPTTVGGPLSITAHDEGCRDGLARLAGAVHDGGARVVGQLLHMGRQRSGGPTDWPMWAPSPLACPVMRETPHPLTIAEIDELMACYARSTRFAREAGFDGVELHAAHGYLPQQFLSPLANTREDAYGGPLAHRLRFLLEALAACLGEAGGMSVGVRISGDELVPGGLTLADMQRVAPQLVAAGAHYLSVSHSTYRGLSYGSMIPELSWPAGSFTHLAAGIRAAIGATVPVLTVGRILQPEQAEQILASGQADGVVLARALIADPEWPRKAREGRAAEIRPCIGCNQGCAGNIHAGRSLRCLTNPGAGRELEWGALEPAARPGRVVVVGAGPAGLEAALTARQRGHEVIVLERDTEPGGNARWAAELHGRSEFGGAVAHRLGLLAGLGVELRCSTPASAAVVLALRPDAVIVATGSQPAPPSLPGAITVEAALADPALVRGAVALVDEDGHVRGAGTAEHLARLGHTVTLVTPLATPGADLPAMNFGPQLHRLAEAGVAVRTQRVPVRRDGALLVVRPAWGGPEETVAADTVVSAGRRLPEAGLAGELAARAPALVVHLVGDCVTPRTALQAIAEGHAAGRAV